MLSFGVGAFNINHPKISRPPKKWDQWGIKKLKLNFVAAPVCKHTKVTSPPSLHRPLMHSKPLFLSTPPLSSKHVPLVSRSSTRSDRPIIFTLQGRSKVSSSPPQWGGINNAPDLNFSCFLSSHNRRQQTIADHRRSLLMGVKDWTAIFDWHTSNPSEYDQFTKSSVQYWWISVTINWNYNYIIL